MSDIHQPQPTEPEERLEAYLDGLMSPVESAEFERQTANDSGVIREIELQAKIDNSLAKTFDAPAPVDILALAAQANTTNDASDTAVVERAKPVPATSGKRVRMIATVLAACVAWVIVGRMIFQQMGDEGYQELALAEIYESSVESGFTPKWVCEDNVEFAQTFQRRQGVPLLLKPESQDVMVGLSYLKGVSPKTTTMLARVDGEPVLVFVDRIDRDTQPEKPSWWSGLNLFRSELEDLVLYEVTPHAEPRVLSSFYIPDASTLPKLPADGDATSDEPTPTTQQSDAKQQSDASE